MKVPTHLNKTCFSDSFRPAGISSDARQLGGLDSNQDKQNQNLLCYRYTTPEEGMPSPEL